LNVRRHLLAGQVIPAHPLALTPQRRLDERRQVALTRYYLDSGAGGLAVAVHTTQFEIRAPRHGLLAPVLELAALAVRGWRRRDKLPVLVAGVTGPTRQAVAEAELAASLGYHAALVSLAGLDTLSHRELVQHVRSLAAVLPIFGFYLQAAVGGRRLDYRFWRELAEVPEVVAVKIAPFDRYATLEVVRAFVEAGRNDVALYTGNDDSIVVDLLTPFRVRVGSRVVRRHIVGGLLGHWAVWTRRAVELLEEIKRARRSQRRTGLGYWLARGAAITDANAAIFDARHRFAGCIPGIHEVLRRQGLLRGTWCLDPKLRLSPGQAQEITRVIRSYPDLTDDEFVSANLERWLA
jgi:dihydrodipicolinate synthase/N-acetylneuraminate lyase